VEPQLLLPQIHFVLNDTQVPTVTQKVFQATLVSTFSLDLFVLHNRVVLEVYVFPEMLH
jgi:hypothetical protein